MVELVRHRQTKEAATDRFYLRPPRHISTLPFASIPRCLRYVRLGGNSGNASFLLMGIASGLHQTRINSNLAAHLRVHSLASSIRKFEWTRCRGKNRNCANGYGLSGGRGCRFAAMAAMIDSKNERGSKRGAAARILSTTPGTIRGCPLMKPS